MAIREIIRMKVTARRDAMVMSRRNLFLWLGSMGIRNFISIFFPFNIFPRNISVRIVVVGWLKPRVCYIKWFGI